MKIGIVGAGIAGRLLAWQMVKKGYQVTLFDKNAFNSEAACSFAAAGILSPLAELEMAEPTIFELGERSIQLYPELIKELDQPVFYRQIGSLVTAHSSDKIELNHFHRMLKHKLADCDDYVQNISVADKEPELAHMGDGLWLTNEGQLDTIGLLNALQQVLLKKDVEWKEQVEVQAIEPGQIKTNAETYSFDWVFDCRGVGSKNELPLRGVRGELLWLQARDVKIDHLTRLMHPRYRIYIVPRPNDIYLLGATEIESEDYSSVSVRSSLELLSAAYSLHKSFGEARIIKQVVNCRPALPDNLPTIELEDGVGRINGLYRHGILLAPAVVKQMMIKFDQAISSQKEGDNAVNS
ncbi:FAD-dependent oxidoreductase [Kangiella koreensis]|uniref:FAD dependent oxidoreductase n=1 Tax=Kangiella koreensis (strain DSM 16069 / JCM 12317 / KCTC 12182 / SW-125) TaxID=523791 RepID=C7R6N2_KANKD|nr:FAD-dependent oxidoreductase [Kangiella koreensis]ACV25548.1 FAD dependent oxidoreductase [Kangiella koreensis DSM 16069]